MIVREEGQLCPVSIDDGTGFNRDNVTLIVKGYNYSEEPKLRRDGRYIKPLKYLRDYREMAYFYEVYVPELFEGHVWEIETSDFVAPSITIYQANRFKNLNVRNKQRLAGKHIWTIIQ